MKSQIFGVLATVISFGCLFDDIVSEGGLEVYQGGKLLVSQQGTWDR
jgi:hypothetical protein